ncbi:Ig-like domain-containing protein, partial [Glaciecola sp.]|nr:Ig-like domain-containing protein [Glaciecola sp.]
DISSGPEYSTNSANAENSFRMYFEFSETVKTTGSIVIKDATGTVMESYDLSTGEGSLGGGIRTDNIPSRTDYNPVAAEINADTSQFVIDLGFTFTANTQYSVEFVGIEDLAGNAINTSTQNFNFTTSATDVVAPQVVAWNLGSSDAAFNTSSNYSTTAVDADIVFKASESLIPDTVGSIVLQVRSGSAVETFDWDSANGDAPVFADGVYTVTGSLGGTLTISGQTVTINAGQNLDYSTTYSVSASGLSDPNGNAFAMNTTSYYFSTITSAEAVAFVGGNTFTHVSTVKLDDAVTIEFAEAVIAGRTESGVAAGDTEQYIKLWNVDGVLVETFAVSSGSGDKGGELSFNANTVSLNAGGNLTYATGYYVTLDAQAIQAATENVSEDAGNVDGDTISTRYVTLTDMDNADTPLNFATEAGSQIDPGWILTPSSDANGAVGDNNASRQWLDGTWSAFPGQNANTYTYLSVGEWAGQQVEAVGDVDGDGIVDFIIGSPNKVYDPSLNPTDGGDNYVYGKYYLVFGEAGDWDSFVNIPEKIALGNAVEIYGTIDNWIQSVSEFGDLNNDGFMDILVNAGGVYPDTGTTDDKLASDDGDTDSGASFVIYGRDRDDWNTSVNVTQLGEQGLEITGGLPQEQLGFSSASGDFNGDGTIDLLFGMPRNDRDGYASGEGFVINGGDFSDSLMSVGTANADTLLGDFDADRLAGQQGNDTIYGLGGADILRGGEGDDVIGLTDLDFILLDGGTNTNSNTGGGDTLRFIGNGINLDFTGYAGANIRSFERIDLTGDGNNEITLNYREVTGLLERQLSTSYGENTTLVVDGNAGDKVNLEGPWQKINSDNTYDHYALDGVVVKVDATITVNQPSWTIPYQGATLDLNAANLPEGFRTDIIEHSATLNNGDRFADTGYVTAIGDVNNDGFADFAVTDETSIQEYLPRVVRSVNTTDYNNYNVDRFSDYVPFYGSVNYQTGVVGYVSEYVSNYTLQTGNVYIVYGQADGIGALDLDLSDNSTVTKITGSMNDNFASYAGSLGDVTGDGIADFIIGAPSSNNTIKFNEGAEQLYTDIDGSNTSLTTDAGYYDGVNAASATALAGVSISHDSWSFDNAGRQYFFFGGNTNLVNNVSGAISTNTITNDASDNTGNHDGFPTTTDSADSRVTDLPNNGSGASTTTYQITPTSTLADLSVANQNATWSPISVGDVNGDGFDDFIDSAGSGVLYFGQSLSGGIDESVTWQTLDLGNFNRINGAGDIDGDGYADLLLGSGAVNYIVFGQADGWLAAPSFGSTNAGSDTAPAVTRIIGEAGYSSPAGSYTTLGDINGDGFNDILIAGNPANNYDAKSNGAAYVIFGSASDADVWDTDISLENLAANGKGFRITGAVDFDLLTSGSWTGVGDMNGDGFADFMLSSPGDAEGDLNATSGSGSSYLFLGQNQIEWQDINASEVQDYGIQILGTGQGVWTALGDIDGDGLDDVALANTTATQIFYGSTNLSVTKDNSWSQLGNQTTVVQTVTEQSGDVLTATRGDNAVAIYGQDRLIGNIGNDTLIGDGGADVLIGGAGDDTLSITDANVFHVDGGEGVDTLVLNGAMAFDLTQISNNAISKIEILHLDNAIQTVTLTEADVRAMTKDTNTAVDDVDYQLGNVLVINSNDTSSSTDVVNLIGADWQDTGVDTSVNGAGTYSIYQASGNNVYVVISDAITPTITNVTQTITDTSGNDALYGSIAADDITATDGNDTLYGQAGMDTLTGGNGSDDLYGGAGNDSIDAGDGDDEIYAGTGDDTIDGGAGYDELDYSTTNDDLTITYATTANQGSVSGATIGTDTYVGIENVIGGTGNDTFVGSTSTDDSLSYASINGAVQVDFSGANAGTVNTVNAGVDTFTGMETIIGSNSNDTFNGVTGGVAVDGLGGSDRLSYIDSSAAVTITFAADSDTSGTVTGNANATFINVEHVQGSTAADVIDGSAISNNLSIYVLGSEGDDTITGGAGSADALAYQAYTVDITADLTAGTVLSSVGNDTVSNIEEINTGSGNDDITGSVGNDIIRGNAGDDTFVGSAGNDTIEGGAGFDTLDFSAQSTDLSLTGLRFNYNSWTYISALGNDRFSSIDQVISGSGNDTITVSSGNANIVSNAGNDTITSTSGRDTIEAGTGDDSVNTSSGDDLIIAGAGNDTYNGSSGNDLVDYASSTSAIDVNLATGAVANDGFGDVDSLVEVEAIAGSDFNDKITGSNANNYISGRGGNDTLDGGAGNDFLVYAEATSDHVINLTTGVVTNGTDTDTVTNFEHVSSGSGDDIITGTTGYNALWGGEGDDTLDGGAGADDLVGGAGNDVFIMLDDGERDSIYGGAGFDILDYSNITFDLSENLSDRGFYNYSLRDISSDLSDGRSNDDADDIIYGIEGIIGGSGNDTLRFTGVYQRVEDNAFSGVYLDGFSGDDSLQGNRGDDTLIGGLGNDTLSADSADDWLDGGVGDDSMHAGNGNDTIMSNDGVDTIDGSGNTDYIDFSLATNAAEVDLTQDDEIVNDGFGNAESIVNIEGFIGSNFADTFTGDASSQIFINSAGNDTFDGGDGSDILDFTGLTAAVTLNTAIGTVSSSASGTDTISNLEVFNTGAGNDTLTGSDEAETFNANAGNDSITAGAGNDTIIASTGNDTIVGGADADTLTFATADTSITVDLSDTSAQSTGLGAYVISGVENIIGSNTSDDLVGDSADNEIAAGSGDDTVSGNAGDDTLSGNDGNDVIYGNAGDDYLSGNAGNDSLYGGAGNDTLEGDAGIDFLSGGDGDDTFNNLNQTGVAVMHGDAGNDIFMMTANSSENADFDFDGGTGLDTVEISTNNAIYDFNNRPNERFENIEILSLATGTQLVRLDNVAVQNMTAATNAAVDNATYNTQQILVVSSDDGADTLYLTGQEWVTTGETTTVNGGTEEYTIYQFGNRDVFVATNTLTSILNNTADDSIIGVSGIDSLAGGVGNDTIQGLAGDDTINGGRDDDILDGGAGVDTLSFEGQTAKITVDLNITTAQATGEGNDIIVNFEQVQGGSGADNLTAHANGSLLSGNAGHDSLYGDVGEDTLLGGADNDVIRGGAGNDSIDGGTYNDMLFGEDGDDTILGGEGTDSIYGGAGVDSIDAGNDDDVVEAGDGDDIVLAGAGNDTVLGQAGADSIRGLDGNDTLSGGTGNDTIEGDNGNDYILGLEDNDSLVGGNGNDTIDGGAGNDAIYGTTGGNLLLGGVGIDTIVGGNQSDTIRGGTGDDSLNGGAGIDVLDMSDSTTAFSFTVADNTSIVSSITDAVLGTDSIVNFEGIIGGSGADTLTGGTGSDIIGGGLGNDILDGGAGVDTLDFSYATQGVIVDFSGDTSETSLVSDGQGGTDTVINFENLNGGAGNDYFAGSNVANTASGFVGDDTLIGNAGNDTLYGGDGNDSLSGGEGQDSLYGESGNDTLSGGADIDRIYGGDGNDSIDAGEGNDSIWGDAGNDTLEGGIGRDSIWGGAGNDTLVGTQDNDFDRYYGEAGTDILDLSAITVDINISTYNGNYTTSNIYYSGLSRDEAYNIEGVILGSGNDNFQVQYIVNYENIYVNGGAGNDTISSLNYPSNNYYRTSNDNYLGGEGDDYISSFAGTDSLDGGTGNDTLMGGTFNDTIFGGDGDDIIHGGYLYSNFGDDDVLNGGAGIDALDLSNTSDAITLDLSTNWQGQISFTSLGTDTVSNFEGVIGGTNADSITGTDGSDVMGGWSGADTLIGGAGIDLLQYGTTTGQVEVNLATQTVVKDGNNNVDTISGFENITTGSSNDKVTGSDDNNHIRMNNGNDTVLGSAGNDTLEGGVGTDTLDYTMFSENIVIDRDAGTATFASGKVDVISDFENILLAGGDDTISVALVNDTIDGGDGVDIVTYNAVTQSITVSNFQPGSTTATNYTVLGQTDQLVNIEGISGGQGDDMMSVLATSTTGAILDGFSGNDTLTGGAGSDTISGGAGDDHIVVTLGADSLDGGDGIDLLDLTMVTVDLSVDLATAWQTGFAVTGLGALSISNFEGIQGGAGDDIIAGSADANFIAGGAGADTLSGGAGIDTLSYTTSTAAVNVDLSTNTVIADGTGSVDTITGFENLFGGSSSDTLTGTTGNNIINGNSGNDTIYSMGGADTLDGGAGTDTLSFAGSTDGYVINMNDQTATSGSLITTFSNFENVVGADGNDEILGTNSNSTLKGGAGDDTLVDGSGSDYLYGGEGNDVFVFNTSNQRDYFYGEAGIDLIDFSNQTSAVSINIEINDNYMQFYINGNWNFAYYIEGAIGTDFNDGLYASTAYGGVYLDGQGGNDTIRGVNNANYQDTLIG